MQLPNLLEHKMKYVRRIRSTWIHYLTVGVADLSKPSLKLPECGAQYFWWITTLSQFQTWLELEVSQLKSANL